MRSIYTRILAWGLVMLFVSLATFVEISFYVMRRAEMRGGPLGSMLRFELNEVTTAYEAGGAAAAASYLERMSQYFPGEHYFTDANGRDLATGVDRSRLLAATQKHVRLPENSNGVPTFAVGSPDGRYWFMAEVQAPIGLWTLIPYYSPILLLVALLSWLLAFRLASPLRKLSKVVEQFGRGNLSVRVNSRRGDEIGALARTFDVMADRMQTLLTAERRLLQDVSHELRSPLARLRFAAELTRTSDDRDAAVARLHKEVGRLDNLVGALLQVTRVEGDPLESQAEIVSVGELLEEVVADSAVEAGPKSVRLDVDAAAGVAIFGDRELLRRAVENVVFNAIRHSPAGAAVDIRLGTGGGRAEISIRDYGEGVPDDLLGKIFSPFFRVDASRDSSTGGVGLGLAIAQRAVQLHHGEIHAANASPGLRVEILMPLHTAA